ncbi:MULTISPECIES: tRNA-dihydrouridine synthase [unclassified Sedimentibacter]|uniref:tRNA-dihydrouridine synthase n=1 Tax=unclassified Sedimentibacter TaxID=2649220 RepID=UPI0027DEEDF5|nr:tRNA-dihydrouridine synthase [Sedimentibacter sp. MB35-C1]WMJ76951.1 tRNA-dihydrouridine synthase [Sedimentibacter sp. MB35-C1]
MNKMFQTKFLGIKFKNPIIVASTDISREMDSFKLFAKSGVGGIITKSVTDAKALQTAKITMMDIRDMNQNKIYGEIPKSYYFFSRGGSMLTMEEYIPKAIQQLKFAKENNVVLIGSISASKVENWVNYAKTFEELGFTMIELNFGNPHGEAADGKLGFLIGQSKELCVEIVKEIMKEVKIPIIVKLTPQISDMTSLVKELKDAGVKAVTIMHRYQGLMIDEETDEPIIGGWAAIGGPWMKPITLANLSKVYKNTGIEICGGNGVDSARDIIDFILCGAGLVQIGSTLMLRGAEYVNVLLDDLKCQLTKRNVKNIQDLKGKTADKIISYKHLCDIPSRKALFNKEVCDSCDEKQCISRCYFGGLKLQDGKMQYNEDFCSGCCICEHVCDKNAVQIKTIN